jgi:aquaporin Z
MVAEATGTMILMLGGPGVAVLSFGSLDGAGMLGVALGFGFALLIAAYAIGHVTGCHINPAVTIGLALMRKVDAARVPAYLIGQLLGAAAGALIIWIIAKGGPGDFDANTDTFATNTWGASHGHFNFGAMALTEIVLTAVLVFVVLSTTRKGFSAGAIGLHVGIALTLIHLISIPVDNTSVNPARSFGMAIFAGGDALEQLWAFFVFPIVGAIVGVVVWLAVDDADLEDSMLGGTPLVQARDALGGVTDRVESGLGAAGAQAARLAPDRPFGPGSRGPLDDGSTPPGFTIKGNVDSMLYHRPDSRAYGATVAEVWFDTEASAQAAGFSLASSHPKD